MSKKKKDDPRSRDDSRLRKKISDLRAWMQQEGIEEQELDWQALAQEEQARRWRERLQQALGQLASHGQELGEALRGLIQQLGERTQAAAEAALEVTFDAAEKVGRVLAGPARECVRPESGLQFSYASPAMRSRLGVAEAQKESVGVFLTPAIPGARVLADAENNRLTVEFWEPPHAPLVTLIPEEADAPPLITETKQSAGEYRAVFTNLPPGRYLLCVFVAE